MIFGFLAIREIGFGDMAFEKLYLEKKALRKMDFGKLDFGKMELRKMYFRGEKFGKTDSGRLDTVFWAVTLKHFSVINNIIFYGLLHRRLYFLTGFHLICEEPAYYVLLSQRSWEL